jgi:arylsulfatase A-like enzyme
MRLRWLFVSLLVLGLAAIGLQGRLLPHPRYNVVILSAESWRADAVRPDIVPSILQAAGEGRGLQFANHRAISAWTIPNVIAVLTGLSPFEQGIYGRGNALAKNMDLPLRGFARDGWHVAGLQSFMAIEELGNLGLDLALGQELVPWLARRAIDEKPFLLWYHYLDTHLPYAPPAPFRPDWRALLPPEDSEAPARIEAVMAKPVIPVGTVAFQPTDAPAIAALHHGAYRRFDAWFADFWAFFQKSGLGENTILVVTADHGDEHLERGRVGHASTNHDGHLHEEITHIPLFVWLPSSHPDRQRVQGVTRVLTDHTMIMPSLARLARGERDEPGGLLDPSADRPARAMTTRGGFQSPEADGALLASATDGRHKVMLTWRQDKVEREEFFDLAADPGERSPLAEAGPAGSRLRSDLLAALGGRTPPRVAEPPAASAAAAPRWISPEKSGAIGFDSLGGGKVRLEWTGLSDATYRIEYEAGQGASRFAGHLDVKGTVKDFGKLDRSYWETFVVPYGRIRFRVGAGRSWSDWIEIGIVP